MFSRCFHDIYTQAYRHYQAAHTKWRFFQRIFGISILPDVFAPYSMSGSQVTKVGIMYLATYQEELEEASTTQGQGGVTSGQGR